MCVCVCVCVLGGWGCGWGDYVEVVNNVISKYEKMKFRGNSSANKYSVNFDENSEQPDRL